MRVLLVEDDRVVRVTVRHALTSAGYQVTDCADGACALHCAGQQLFDIVLTDVRLPKASGLEVLRHVRKAHPGTAVVLMTAWATADDAVTAMREGARDYISKPFEMDELLLRLERVKAEVEQRTRLEQGGAVASGRVLHSFRGESGTTRELLSRIEAAAAMDVGVLITGETGSGKELCARTIHERSARAGQPFVAVNCGAIPENLLESELFGHERGAFTGADRRRVGRFEAAHGGTLFLDEVGELPLAQQVKVLRALDTHTVDPLGSSGSMPVDVRIIAATNADLDAAVREKRFRQDLFFRLNVVDIQTPALRDRRVDIPALTADFLAEISVRHQRPLAQVSPGALSALMRYEFPGNVRELIHALEHAVAMARGAEIAVEHLPRTIRQGCIDTQVPAAETLDAVVEQFERQYIQQVLARVGGHRAQAAQLLGISRKSLWQKLKDDGS